MADPSVTIEKGAQESPTREKPELVETLKTQLAEYVDAEFQKLTAQDTSFTCFPSKLEKFFNLADKGEKAEYDVYNALRGVKIPGLQMTVFNGRCYAGRKRGEEFQVPREIDFAIFLQYRGKFKVKLLEVKGSSPETARKGINKTRGHALAQLRNHKEILGHKYKHNIPEETFERVHSSVVWPNLERNFFCEACDTANGHERFKLPPATCKARGNSKEATVGNDLFAEDLKADQLQGDLQSFTEDDSFDISQEEWVDLRNIFLLLSVGCLFDEMDKTFILLNKEQVDLISIPKHEMSRPKFIYGPAGSGKTLTTLAMIERLFKRGEIDENNQVLYLCSNQSVLQYVESELTARNIPLNDIKFRTYSTLPGYASAHSNPTEMFPQLIKEYGAIFLDEAEDLGIEALNQLNATISMDQKMGYFWVLFDHLQSSPASKGQTRSQGPSTKNTTYMCKVYRSTNNNMRFLRKEPLIAMCDYTTSVGHTVEGPKVNETVIGVQRRNQLNSERTRAKIVKGITSKVIQLTTEEGVHPGDVAVLYDDYDFQQIFGCQGYDICSALDECAKAVLPKPPERAPKSSLDTDKSVMFPHQKALTSCECRYFIGPFRQLKGLTVKVVIYLSIQGSSQGHNRLAAYTSLTRSSCLVEMFYIQVKSMKMVNYQIKKYDMAPMLQNFSVKKAHEDEIFYVTQGFERLHSPNPVVFDYPSAIGSNSSSFKSTSTTTGTLTFLKKPDDVESEWVEDCLIPKSFYSHPIPGRGNFVRGCEEYTIPVDPRKKKEGSRRRPREVLDIESLRKVQLAKQKERPRQKNSEHETNPSLFSSFANKYIFR